MRTIFVILFSLIINGTFGQAISKISVGYGLNNSEQNELKENDILVTDNNLMGFVGYEYVFKSRASLKFNLAYSSFDADNYQFGNPSTANYAQLGFNIGFFYHFISSKRFDVSSGFYLTRHINHVVFKNPTFEQNYGYNDYSISLVNAQYEVFKQMFLFTEVIIGSSMFSNYYVGLAYQFPRSR